MEWGSRVTLAPTRPKDPAKVKAGNAAALARWGPDRKTVRLDELTPEQRRLVLALVEAAKSAGASGDG